MDPAYKLPALPYAYDALEPHISGQIMELHHKNHHQTYVNGLNAALKSGATALQNGDVASQIANQEAIKFHGGGHLNHSLFWENLTPASSPSSKRSAAPRLDSAIADQFGSYDAFEGKFSEALLGIRGSGWGWLVSEDGGAGKRMLRIVTCKDQDLVGPAQTPVFGVDMWEHAFYLQYQTAKPKYVAAVFKVINWATAEQRFVGSREDAFKGFKALM